MATNFLWGAIGGNLSLAGSNLNSLGNNTISAATLVNNSGNYQMGTLAFQFGSAAFTNGGYVQVFAVPSYDTGNTTFPTVGNVTTWLGGASSNYLIGTLYINGTTATQVEVLPYVTIPPGYFNCYIYNLAMANLSSSGNILNFIPTPTQY